MTSKKQQKRAAKAAHLAQQIFGRTPSSPPSSSPPQPHASPPLQAMASRRDSSPPHRSTRPEYIPTGPRGSGGDATYFTSRSWQAPRDYQDRRRSRSRSRSRSPDIDRRRIERENEEYRREVRIRTSENYRPQYDDTPTRSSIKDSRRTCLYIHLSKTFTHC